MQMTCSILRLIQSLKTFSYPVLIPIQSNGKSNMIWDTLSWITNPLIIRELVLQDMEWVPLGKPYSYKLRGPQCYLKGSFRFRLKESLF